MKFKAQKSDFNTLQTDCLIIGFNNAEKISEKLPKGDIAISDIIQSEDFKAKSSELLYIPHFSSTIKRLLLVGLGESYPEAALLKSLSAITKTLSTKPFSEAAIDFDSFKAGYEGKADIIHLFAQSFKNQNYSFTQFKSETDADDAPEKTITFTTSDNEDLLAQQLDYITAVELGSKLTRDLGNMPGNICYPDYLLKQAAELAASYDSISVSALGESEMIARGFGSFMSVSKGSEKEGKLISMNYQPDNAKNSKPLVLIGKGITFDTGGISLKPGARMDEMKYDMCGAATVFGVMKTIGELNLPLNVIGVIAAAENMPDGGASRPGDIVTSLSGKTIEILNTDAEGRLVLCDTLTYAQQQYNPELMLNFATLTGACVVALGDKASAVYSRHDDLSQALVAAGEATYDRAWPMPLWEEYSKQLESPFADLANIGGPKAGSVTAACFLAEFVDKELPWAHFDIAGTAWNDGSSKNATGRPVALVTEFLVNKSK